jgi:exocyst complex component 4
MELSQGQVKEARAALLDAKEALGNKRADLVQIWSRGQSIEEMIRIIDQMWAWLNNGGIFLIRSFSENLKNIADLLETLISEKRFLQASVLLVQSLKLANKPDMQDIGAVSDLRNYLQTQEAVSDCGSSFSITCIWYLLSSYFGKYSWKNCMDICTSSHSGVNLDGRRTLPDNKPVGVLHTSMNMVLTSYAVPRVEYEDADLTPDMAMRPESSKRSRLSRFLDDLAIRNNDPPYDFNDTTNIRNSAAIKASVGSASSLAMGNVKEGSSPESDSFAYMEMLLESLAVLGRLGNALDITAQRVASEIYALTDGVLEDVSERAEFARRNTLLGSSDMTHLNSFASLLSTMSSTSTHLSSETLVVASTRGKDGFLPASALRSVALESSSKQADHEILRDLFWTLYSKLYAVVQGLRVISEVSNRIGSVGPPSPLLQACAEQTCRGESSRIRQVPNPDRCSRLQRYGCPSMPK